MPPPAPNPERTPRQGEHKVRPYEAAGPPHVPAAAFGYNDPIVPTFLRILSLLRPYTAPLVFGFVCLTLSVALELAPPLVWKVVVDDVVIRRHLSALWPAVAALTLIAGGSAVLSAVRSRLLETVGQRFVYDLRNTLYDKLSHQSLAYFNEARTGDLMSRASSDVDAVQEVVIRGTDSIIANFLRLAGVAVIFCALNLKLGLATLLPILLVGVFLKLFNKRVKGVYKAAREKLGLVNAKLQDNLSGIRVIKAFARERAEADAFERVNQSIFKTTSRRLNYGRRFSRSSAGSRASATPSPSATGRGSSGMASSPSAA